MRKQFLVVLLSLLVVALITAAAQTQGAGPEASRHAALQSVNVVRTDDGVNVEINAHGAVKPHLSTLDHPARVVVDLPNTVIASSPRLIDVYSDGVKAVRLGTDGQTTPNTRIVVDLMQACPYELVSGSDNRMVLKLHTKTAASKTSAPAPAAEAKTEVAAAPVAAPVKSQAEASLNQASLNQICALGSRRRFRLYRTFLSSQGFGCRRQCHAGSDRAARTRRCGGGKVCPAAGRQPLAGSQRDHAVSGPAVNMAAEQKMQAQQAPAITGPKYTGEPISVNLKDVDLKDFFRLIHEISGLNVVLDPNVKGSLTIVLDDVPWDQALDIVLKNNDLARQLEGNVLRIATVETMRKEAESRRAQVEAEALAVDKVTVTRFLSYAHSKDVVPTVKSFLTQRGDVISDDRTNALIIQDIPSVMPGIDRLLTQLDRKTQEVEIEARVVAATRSFARDIGTQLGFGWGNGTSAIGGASAAGSSPTTVNGLTPGYITSGGTTTGSTIPLFSNLPVTSPTSGLSFVNASNNVRIDAILTMAESRGLLKILSRPRVVTQNNIQALVRQGVRVPIVTQAQLGGPPTVTYVDAFLRLTVVPQITSEGTIFLNVDVENTTPDFGRTVQGNPTLITQQATTQVLVTDGGTVVIGGVIQTQNSINISQVPLLGNIPMLGNLFKHTTVSTSNQELIFFITPRIIQT